MPLVPPYIATLRPYEPGRTAEEVERAYGVARAVKLASNENPLGPSPLALETLRTAAQRPDPYPRAREHCAVSGMFDTIHHGPDDRSQ